MNEVEIRITSRDDSGPGEQSARRRFDGLKKAGQAAAVGIGAAGATAGALFASGLAANISIEKANDKLAGQLGLTTKESEMAGKAAGAVYADNWGESVDEVNDAIRAIGTNIQDVGSMTQAELKDMTEQALAYSSTMGKDVNLATEAVGAMLKNGLAKNATEAFDILTAGSQNGVDKADDLLETFQEYSPQFHKLGIDGKDALNLLSAGLQAGARDTDVIADAFKELSIRTIDGTALSAQGFKAIGLNAKEMAKEFGKGGESARQATQKVIDGLLGIKDPVKQNIAGTALFGTQWEDTMKQILPAMQNVDGKVKDIDGSTKKMADQIGDNAAGKIESMKRKFEQWTQSMSDSDSAMGTMVTGVLSLGGGAVSLAGNLGMVALAFKGMGAAMLLNPIGLVVLAIAGLAAGMVILWKKSQTARELMSGAFAGIATVVLTTAELILKAWKGMSVGVLQVVETTLRALGKIPGNDWADRAADDVKGFKEDTERFFDKAIGKTQEWRNAAQRMPKEIKLRGDEKDLQAKLRSSQRALAKLPKSKRTVVQAEVSTALRRIALVQAKLLALKNRNVSVTTYYSEIRRDQATANRGKATGGISGAATGGLRGAWTMVGEAGRELVKLPFGSQVIGHGSTENMLKNAIKAAPDPRAAQLGNALRHAPAGKSGTKLAKASSRRSAGTGSDIGQVDFGGDFGDGGPDVIIEFRSDGSNMGNAILEVVRKSIRARGGNVQLILGS